MAQMLLFIRFISSSVAQKIMASELHVERLPGNDLRHLEAERRRTAFAFRASASTVAQIGEKGENEGRHAGSGFSGTV